jgi:6-phosphogluconate dehydrogenase
MQIGIIGLGRMGGNIARRLMMAGHQCVVFDANVKPRENLAKEGATAVESRKDGKCAEGEAASGLDDVARRPDHRTDGRAFGQPLRARRHRHRRRQLLLQGRHPKLSEKRIRYVDCGTSGGVWGLERGYCMMIGGPKQAVDHLEPIFAALAPGPGNIPRTPGRERGDPRPERGYIHAGPSGAGHFVKMVHNGIEYGLMQAYAEGFDILRKKDSDHLPADERFTLNIPDIAETWRRGSVIASWLLDLGAAALANDSSLSEFSGYVQDSGEGRWTIEAAIEEAVPADVLSSALYARFRSRQEYTFGDKLLSAMRFGFGGHIEGKESIDPQRKPAKSRAAPDAAE